MSKKDKKIGRPVVYPLPEPIDASPEEVAQVVLQMPPKTDWRFEQESGRPIRRGPK